MRIAVAKAPYETFKAEAANVGLVWRDLNGLLVQTFEDGTAFVVVQEGDHADADRFVAHLIDVGMAAST